MKRWLSLFVVTLFSLPFVVGQGWGDDVSESGDSLRLVRAVELTTDGIRELNVNGDANRAYALFKGAVESDSTYAPAKYSMAQLMINNYPDSAVVYSRSAYESDTLNHWYLNLYAQSMISAGQYIQSRPLYEKLVELRPLDLNAYRLLALLYQQESRPEEAIALLDTAELRVGRNPYLMALKRQVLLSTNQVDRAVREAQEMVDEAPYMVENRLALAELYGSLRRDSLAVLEYDAAMQIDSTRIETMLSYGEFLKQRNQNSSYLKLLQLIVANDDLDVANKIDMVREMRSNKSLYQQEGVLINSIISLLYLKYPNEQGAVELHVQNLIALGMLDEALALMKSRVDEDPTRMESLRMVIDIERYKGRPDSALYYLDRAIAQFPEDYYLQSEKAYVLASMSRYEESIEIFKSGLNRDSVDRSVIWGAIGDVEHQRVLSQLAQDTTSVVTMRQLKRSMRSVYSYYERALKISKNNAMVLNNYAYFLSEYGGDLNYALKMSKRSNELDSSNSIFIDTYAWILYQMGLYDEAKVEMRRAVSLDNQNNYEIMLHYGEILFVLGESTMADFYWKKALQYGATQSMVDERRRSGESKKDE